MKKIIAAVNQFLFQPKTAYAPNYTKIDSGPYEMDHMSHVISRDGLCDLSVIPNEATYEVVRHGMRAFFLIERIARRRSFWRRVRRLVT